MLDILFKSFGSLAPKDFYIIWHSNILVLSVPGMCCSRAGLCQLGVISTYLLIMDDTSQFQYEYD